MPAKFIVNVCLTGMVATRAVNPAVPMTAGEIARDVEACLALGASMFHIHARDEEEQPDWRREGYQAILQSVRKVSREAILCVSTSGRRVTEIEKRTACLDADPKPEMGSLTMGSINFPRGATLNSLQTIRGLIRAMDARGIKPEIEVFDHGMAQTVRRFAAEGLLRPPYFVNLLLGNVSSAGASLLDLAAILQHLPPEAVWCVGGIGRDQLKANTLGILFGHGVRVGLEDNLYLDEAKTLATNPALVERAVKLGALLGKVPYSPAETRSLLGL